MHSCYHTYILESQVERHFYTGYTSNLMKNIFFSILSLCAVAGCSTQNNLVAPLRAPGFDQPVATGIYVTTIDPTPIDTWGNPSFQLTPTASGNSLSYAMPAEEAQGRFHALSKTSDTAALGIVGPLRMQLELPYPNPTIVGSDISFALPRTALVSLWIVRARWVGDPSEDLSNVDGGVVITPQVVAVANLIVYRSTAAGFYRYSWNGQADDGKLVSPGFYRVYLKVDEGLMWSDIFLYRQITDLPPDLRKYGQH